MVQRSSGRLIADRLPIVSATLRLPLNARMQFWLRVVGHSPAIAGAHSWCVRCQIANESVMRQSALRARHGVCIRGSIASVAGREAA